MADATKKDIAGLNEHISEMNAGIKTMIGLRKEEDTVKSLFAGNMFEILNANRLREFKEKLDRKEGLYKIDNLIGGGDGVSPMDSTHGILKRILKTDEGTLDIATDTVEGIKNLGKTIITYAKDTMEATDSLGVRIKDSIFSFLSGGAERKIEEQKDQANFFQRTIMSITGAIAKPFKFIAKTFDSLKDSLLGKAGLITALIFFSAFMIAQFPKISEGIGILLTALGDLIKDLINFKFGGEFGFWDMIRENFTTFIGLGLLVFAKSIITFFGGALLVAAKAAILGVIMAASGGLMAAAGAAITFIGALLLQFVLIPYLLWEALMGFFDGYNKRLAEGGGFWTSFLAGLGDAVAGFFSAFWGLIEKLADMIGVGDFYRKYVKEPFIELWESFKNLIPSFDDIGDWISNLNPFGGGKALGGPVTAGAPYLVGEKGPELFVPGRAGAIPGLGGGNIVVNNNQVNQSAQSHSHQHSNVSITDEQQQKVGL